MLFDFPVGDDTELEPGVPMTSSNPQLTEWRHICSCLCCDLNEITSNGQKYLNHWKITPTPVIAVNSIIWTSYLVFIFCDCAILKLDLLPKVILGIFAFLFSFSHAMIIYEGPGYLPYYYPLQIASKRHNIKDYLSGVVTTNTQEEYVKSMGRPPRVNYFSSVHRYVIRPDHLCGWTGSFIGKKNHKLFFLFNFYGVIYIALFLFYNIYAFSIIIKMIVLHPYMYGIMLLYIVIAIFFLAFTSIFLFTSISRFSFNITQFEEMKRKTPVHAPASIKELVSNWEEVFGPSSKWYTWLIPFGAFHGVPDEELLNLNQHSDRML